MGLCEASLAGASGIACGVIRLAGRALCLILGHRQYAPVSQATGAGKSNGSILISLGALSRTTSADDCMPHFSASRPIVPSQGGGEPLAKQLGIEERRRLGRSFLGFRSGCFVKVASCDFHQFDPRRSLWKDVLDARQFAKRIDARAFSSLTEPPGRSFASLSKYSFAVGIRFLADSRCSMY